MGVSETAVSASPGFRLTTGNPEAIEEAIAAEIGTLQADDPLAPVGVLLGGTLQRPYLQRRLAELNGGIVNVRFLMPSELALALGEQTLVRAGKRPLPPLADRILLRQIAGEHDGYFEPVRETPGLADALHRLVRELRGAGYDAKTFAKRDQGHLRRPKKEKSLAEIFAEFLQRGARASTAPTTACSRRASSTRPGDSLIRLRPLGSSPPPSEESLEKLAKQHPGHRLPCRRPKPTRTRRTPTSARGSSGAGAEPSGPSIRRGTRQHPSRRACASCSTSRRRAASRRTGPQAALGARSRAARSARSPAPASPGRATGSSFHEMAIAYRNPDPYRSLIESAFREAKIPVYLHEGSPMAERPLGRRVLSLLDLMDSDLERRRVMDFVTDGRLPEETKERYENAVATRWDRASREAGVVKGLDQWKRRLATHKSELEESDQEWQTGASPRGRVSSSQLRRGPRRGARGPSRPSSLVRAPRRARPAAAQPTSRTRPRSSTPSTASAASTRSGPRWDTSSSSPPFATAIENLRSDEVLGQRPGAFARRGVNVLDVNSLQHLRFRAVAIVGLAERSFPIRPAPRPDPARRRAREAERERARTRSRSASGAPIPSRCSSPSPSAQRRTACWRASRARAPERTDRSSRPRSSAPWPKPWSATGLKRRRSTSCRPSSTSAPQRSGSAPASSTLALSEAEYDRTLIQLDRDLGRALLLSDAPEMKSAFEARKRPALGNEADSLRRRAQPDALEALIEDLRRRPRGLSVSRIHKYADCPQRFFLDSVLGAKPIEEPEETISISRMDRGSLIHRILERFLQEDPAKGEEKLYGKGEEKRLLKIAAEQFKKAEDRGQTGYALTWRYDRVRSRRTCAAGSPQEREDPAFREHPEGSYEVGFGEWHYGNPDNDLSLDKPLEIEIGSRQV